MEQPKNFTGLVMSVLGFPLALAAAGTLVDETLKMCQSAVHAVRHDRVSYIRWNQHLQKKRGAVAPRFSFTSGAGKV